MDAAGKCVTKAAAITWVVSEISLLPLCCRAAFDDRYDPSHTCQCNSYCKEQTRCGVKLQAWKWSFSLSMYVYMYIYIYLLICMHGNCDLCNNARGVILHDPGLGAFRLLLRLLEDVLGAIQRLLQGVRLRQAPRKHRWRRMVKESVFKGSRD